MGRLNRPVSIQLFFTIFELSWLGEKTNKARKEQVSFKTQKTQHRYFKAFSESLGGGWKNHYFWIVPTEEAGKAIAEVLPDGSIGEPFFPIMWNHAHFLRRAGDYAYTVKDLSEVDKESLQMIKTLSSLMPPDPKGDIPCRPFTLLVGRALEAELGKMAGAAWSSLEKMALKSSSKPSMSKPAQDVVVLDGSSKTPQTPRNQGTNKARKGRSPPMQDARSPKRNKATVQFHETGPDDDIPVIEIESLGETDFERFKREPMVVCASLCMAVGKAMKQLTEDGEKKAEEARAERDTALANLEAMKKKLEKAINSKNAALEAKGQAEEDNAKAVKRNKELAAQVKDLKDDVAGLEKEKADLEDKVQEVANLAKDAATFQFQNAIDQLRLLNADLDLNVDDQVLKPEHCVEGNEIVLAEVVDDNGAILRQRSVVYGRT